jgi:antitoxin VapB
VIECRLFKNGRSQAARLPKELCFEGDRVYIKQVGEAGVLTPYRGPLANAV